MITLRSFWRNLIGQTAQNQPSMPTQSSQLPAQVKNLDIAPNDPLLAYFQNVAGVVEVDKLALDSPAVRAMRTAGMKLAIPLVSQGELIGLINLGPRLSRQDYSSEDRRLLDHLATQATPAVRVAQLVRQQQAEIQSRTRLDQELRVAQRIQQMLLPKELPALSGWGTAAYYQPAREVGGDFYDFIPLKNGRLGLAVGDVTDKGIPAALVMATTRTLLRAVAQRLLSPGQVLEQVNEILCPDMPPNMFVTCLYAVLDPASGQLQYANAGHDPPYRRTATGIEELRVTGMPLGLLPQMTYDEKETVLAPGDCVLLYSDGLVEAHNPKREMFGFPRLAEIVAAHPPGPALIDVLLAELANFAGPAWEQEDDVTLVTLQRVGLPTAPSPQPLEPAWPGRSRALAGAAPFAMFQQGFAQAVEGSWQTLAEFTFPSEPGNDRLITEQVAAVVAQFELPPLRLQQLKTAVSEATMNAMEHGNLYRPELAVSLQVLTSDVALAVRITDQGGNRPIPLPAEPDLEAKLAGLQTPWGWGLFLIEQMVDEMRVSSDEHCHTIELIFYKPKTAKK